MTRFGPRDAGSGAGGEREWSREAPAAAQLRGHSYSCWLGPFVRGLAGLTALGKLAWVAVISDCWVQYRQAYTHPSIHPSSPWPCEAAGAHTRTTLFDSSASACVGGGSRDQGSGQSASRNINSASGLATLTTCKGNDS